MEQLPLDSMEKEKNIPMEEDPVLISADQQIETDENNLAKIEIDQENLSNDEEELNEGRVCERMSYEGFKIFDSCRYIPHTYCQNWQKKQGYYLCKNVKKVLAKILYVWKYISHLNSHFYLIEILRAVSMTSKITQY